MEVKVGLATWSGSEGSFKAPCGKTHVKVKSNAVRDNIVLIRVLTVFLHHDGQLLCNLLLEARA